MSRSVIVASAAGNRAQTIQTSAKTWGELKRETAFAAIYPSGVEAILSTNKTTLNRDEAELPEGSFNIFLVPTKNKAGVETIVSSLNTAIEDAVDSSSVDKEDVDAVLEVVFAAVTAFFVGTSTGATATGASSAEATALAEAKKFML
jgi:hypothetical protein